MDAKRLAHIDRVIAEKRRDEELVRGTLKVRLALDGATITENAMYAVTAMLQRVAKHIDEVEAAQVKYGVADPAPLLMELMDLKATVTNAAKTVLSSAKGLPEWTHTDLDWHEIVLGEPDGRAVLAYALEPDKGTVEMLPSYARQLARACPEDFRSFCAAVGMGMAQDAEEITFTARYAGAKDASAWRDAWVLAAKAIASMALKKPVGKALDGGKTLEITIPLPPKPKRKTAEEIAEMAYEIEERLGMQGVHHKPRPEEDHA
jgi:hypothetical protein